MRHKKELGVTLVEVFIAVTVISVIVLAAGFSINTYVDARGALLSDLKAVYLAEEGYEIVRALRDEDWTALEGLTIGVVHYLDVSTTTLDFTSTPEVIDGEYQRSFVVRSVYRDANDDVVDSSASGATIDPEAREIEVMVVGPTGTSSLTALLTNLRAL